MLKTIKSSSIVKNLGLLVSGTVLAQIIVIAFQAVLRRVYSPADFGAFAVYMSLVGIVITIASFRYEQTIVLPDENEKAKTLVQLTVILTLIVAFLCFLIIVFFKDIILIWLDFPEDYGNWLYLLPISILVFSFAQSLNYYLIREKKFKTSALNKIFRRASEGGLQVSYGYFGNSFGLVLGDIVGRVLMIIRSVVKCPEILKKRISFHEIKEVAREYKNFPLKNGVPALFNTFSALLPILFINKIFTEEITGHFDLARMVLIVPISLITASLSQVFLQNISEKKNKMQSIKKVSLGTFFSLFVSAAFFGLVIHFFGNQLFAFVFGKQNALAGNYASVIVWAFALKFVISPFNVVFAVLNKIGLLSIWQILYFGLILLLIYLPYNSIESFLSMYLKIEIISYSIVGFLGFITIFKYEKNLVKA